jgi:hypothetical protein
MYSVVLEFVVDNIPGHGKQVRLERLGLTDDMPVFPDSEEDILYNIIRVGAILKDRRHE